MKSESAPPRTPQLPPPIGAGTAGSCRNCGTLLTGRYCANCSQAADVHVPSTRELMHEALEGVTHSDSRLWRTLYLLWFKPGQLTREFVVGRRAAYLPPFRLYLVLSILFFLVASLSNSHANFVKFDRSTAQVGSAEATCASVNFTWLRQDWSPRAQHICSEIRRDDGANLLHLAIATMPRAMFIFLPLVAFLHMLMYWRPRHRYAEHLLFFLHVHAFFFSVITVVVLSNDAGETWPFLAKAAGLATLLLWVLPVYTVIAMRQVFGRSWTRTFFKACALFAVYFVVLNVTLLGVFVYAALQM